MLILNFQMFSLHLLLHYNMERNCLQKQKDSFKSKQFRQKEPSLFFFSFLPFFFFFKFVRTIVFRILQTKPYPCKQSGWSYSLGRLKCLLSSQEHKGQAMRSALFALPLSWRVTVVLSSTDGLVWAKLTQNRRLIGRTYCRKSYGYCYFKYSYKTSVS